MDAYILYGERHIPSNKMPIKLTESTEELLDEFQERGNLTTGALIEFTSLSRPTVTKHLDRLHTADCIEYLHEPTALWRLVDDPRNE